MADPTRSLSACLRCRRLKLKCAGPNKIPCERCSANNSECLFVAPRPAGRAGKRSVSKMSTLNSSDKLQLLEQHVNRLETTFNSSIGSMQQMINMIASRVGVENISTLPQHFDLPALEASGAEIEDSVKTSQISLHSGSLVASTLKENNDLAGRSDLILRGIASPKQVEDLYDFFYENCRSTISFLDDTILPLDVVRQSPLYLAAICTIACRGINPELYPACLSEMEDLIKDTFNGPTPSILALKGIMLYAGWHQRIRLFGYVMSIALELGLNTSVLQLEDEEVPQSEDAIDRARTWLSLCVFDLVTNLNRPFLISRMKEYLPLSKKLLSSPHFRSVDYRIHAWIEAFAIAADAKGTFKDPNILQSRPMLKHVSNLLTAFDERVDEWFYKVNNAVDPLYQTFPNKQDRNRLMVSYGFIRMYINGFALHGLKSGEYMDDPSRMLFIQKAVESAKLILRTGLESATFRRSLRYAVEYQATAIYLAVNFLLKAVTAVHIHLDVHSINGVLRQVIEMFDEAQSPDSAKYVLGILETITDITHITVSPMFQPPDTENAALFDINNFRENPLWHEEFPYVDRYSLD